MSRTIGGGAARDGQDPARSRSSIRRIDQQRGDRTEIPADHQLGPALPPVSGPTWASRPRPCASSRLTVILSEDREQIFQTMRNENMIVHREASSRAMTSNRALDFAGGRGGRRAVETDEDWCLARGALRKNPHKLALRGGEIMCLRVEGDSDPLSEIGPRSPFAAGRIVRAPQPAKAG